MEKYQIIPRKFRPKRFAEVAGHPAIVTTLKNAIARGRLGQAYLFCGARGCGKTTLARLLAKALNCRDLREDCEPCNTCISCQEIAEGRSLDVIEIDGASNRGIDDIREINETVGYAPHQGPYKIFIIDEVHMLTKEAFNALLKTLEEPPKHVKFFFATTEPHKIPQTIISRTQRFNLSRIPQQDLIEKLRRICEELHIETEEEALMQISHLAEGSLRDAESLLDQLICTGKTPLTLDLTREIFGLLKTDHLFALDEAILTQNHDKALSLAKQFYESGHDIGSCLDSLLDHFRTHLLMHFGHPAEGPYLKLENTYTKDQCLTFLETLIDWQQQMLKTPFKKIHLEMLLVCLIRKSKNITLDHLIERLLELEGKVKNDSPQPCPKEQGVILEEAPFQNVEKKEEEKKPLPPKDEAHPSKYDTLMRFAAVELEGSLKKG